MVDELGQLVLSTPKAASQAQVERWQKIKEDFRAFVAKSKQKAGWSQTASKLKSEA